MDEFIKQLILQLPNLAFAVYIVWWMSKRLDRLIDSNERLVTQLLELCADDAGEAEDGADDPT